MINLNNVTNADVDETGAELNKALEAKRLAEQGVRAALDVAFTAMKAEMMLQIKIAAQLAVLNGVAPDTARQDAKSYLIAMANQNRAEWSGGPNNATNVLETMARSIALQLLARGV